MFTSPGLGITSSSLLIGKPKIKDRLGSFFILFLKYVKNMVLRE